MTTRSPDTPTGLIRIVWRVRLRRPPSRARASPAPIAREKPLVSVCRREDVGQVIPFTSPDRRFIDFLVEEAVRVWQAKNSQD
jgi:hypothetical protein